MINTSLTRHTSTSCGLYVATFHLHYQSAKKSCCPTSNWVNVCVWVKMIFWLKGFQCSLILISYVFCHLKFTIKILITDKKWIKQQEVEIVLTLPLFRVQQRLAKNDLLLWCFIGLIFFFVTRNFFPFGNIGPCKGEIADQELGWLIAFAIWAVILGLSLAPWNTDIRGLVTSSNGCKLPWIMLLMKEKATSIFFYERVTLLPT